MKHIIFNLTDCFELTNVCTSNLFAHENETAELRINTNVKDNYVYYLHKKQNGKKDFVKLEKTESYLYYPLNSAFLNQSGKAQLQLRAVYDEDKAIESNPVELYIHDFINASNEPTPQQASVIEKLFNEANDLLIDAQELKEKADTLESLDVIEIENGVAISYDEKQFNIYNGKDGLDGEQGPEGPKGETGETGPRGPEGPRGPMGIQGPTGPRGETGPKGDRGAEGPRGPVGPMGVQGPKGSDGAPGPTGKDGAPGKTPIKGIDYWTTEDIVEMTSDVKMQVEPEIQEAISIAKGANRAHVFNTYNDMMAWLAVEEHKKDLIPGDNLYLRDLDVPDYWWDGAEPQMLETQKVDLSDYATKEELGGKQNKLIAGENITINPVTNEISATAGGSGDVSYDESEDTDPLVEELPLYPSAQYSEIGNRTVFDAINAGGGTNDVTDVQINGASIVDDNKVANIPELSYSNDIGLFHFHAGYGFSRGGTDGNVIYQTSASAGDIEGRRNRFNPIVSENLDLAVKCAMCDGKGASWTEQEKANARARMGVGSTLQSFYDQSITYGAEGLGQVITQNYSEASYINPIVVACSIALYGNTALIYGIYRPQAMNSFIVLEAGGGLRRLAKTGDGVWSFTTFNFY